MTDYEKFIAAKALVDAPAGLHDVPALSPMLFEYQRDIVRWALIRGRACIWADCGLGKTPMQLEWSRHVPGRVLVFAPLAVSQQTIREGEKFGIEVAYARSQQDADIMPQKIIITNYEMIENFDASKWGGIVLDESSIIKSHDGATRDIILSKFCGVPFRLACTATPAPNDYMEIGNHAEFVGSMTREEMLAMFFVHDGGETQKWRLKGHAKRDFWKWLCSWAVMIRKPSDLGYSDDGFSLPPIVYHEHVIHADKPADGNLIALPAATLQERIAARRATIDLRVQKCAELVNKGLQINSECINFQECKQNTSKNTIARTETSGLLSQKNIRQTVRKGESNTCESIMPSISQLGINERQNSAQKFLQDEEKNTEQTSSTERQSRKVLASGQETTQKRHLLRTSDASDCLSTNSTRCFPSKDQGAQYAEESIPTHPIDDCTLTTATRRDLCADYCAQTAIPDSENSETTPNYFGRQWIIWCNLNGEGDALEQCIDGAVQVSGNDDAAFKEWAAIQFSLGKIRVLISKPKIFGFGLNFQNCANMAFVGLSDSWESYYQAVRRCWRFGQKNTVNVHVITADIEGAVVSNIKRKERDAENMAKEMVEHMKDINTAEVHGQTTRETSKYVRDVKRGENWEMHLADCVDVLRETPDDSLHFSVFSPPFSSLYTYSNSDRDMGNSKDDGEFMRHFGYMVKELYRALMPGRLVSFHCMNLPTSKQNHGFIGIRDFRGELIRLFESFGFIFHSEVCIWKDPVTAMQRTKALGLLWKQIKKDSCMSRQGIPDYLVTMRKPGDNPERVEHTADDFPVLLWQKYASPVWMDINPSDTLQKESARDDDDERHICPLQLEVIRRALKLWSNPGDVVFSPFGGIASEGYVALQEGRKFKGVELKRSYWVQGCANLAEAEAQSKDGDLFSMVQE